jgi:hypothetical protein
MVGICSYWDKKKYFAVKGSDTLKGNNCSLVHIWLYRLNPGTLLLNLMRCHGMKQ